MSKKVYKTMQGREIDLEAIMSRNETMPAVGNVKVNARGDELGPGGKIIKKREDIIAEYYEDNPTATPQQGKTKAPELKKSVQPTAVNVPTESDEANGGKKK